MGKRTESGHCAAGGRQEACDHSGSDPAAQRVRYLHAGQGRGHLGSHFTPCACARALSAWPAAMPTMCWPIRSTPRTWNEFVEKCTKMMGTSTLPSTAVNLSWALNRMHGVLMAEKDGKTVAEMKVRLMDEANAIREEDIQISRNIGAYGFELLEKLGKGVGIATHCNVDTLATAKYGTALAPMYIALEHGWDGKKDLHVYCDETRPLLQGARLSRL